ncbi:unnamed protein product [Cyprideis torosa]|uniref:Uncharacterized protein n=1 Tax=Cyprideis torosa TaxID=163714 RepID=A0A7R8WDX3_9CRUS|nr:unnamed protein product [Cyprideis torosa]CAG0895182.1 unnamed protein product [Cyprideis torosa]
MFQAIAHPRKAAIGVVVQMEMLLLSPSVEGVWGERSAMGLQCEGLHHHVVDGVEHEKVTSSPSKSGPWSVNITEGFLKPRSHKLQFLLRDVRRTDQTKGSSKKVLHLVYYEPSGARRCRVCSTHLTVSTLMMVVFLQGYVIFEQVKEEAFRLLRLLTPRINFGIMKNHRAIDPFEIQKIPLVDDSGRIGSKYTTRARVLLNLLKEHFENVFKNGVNFLRPKHHAPEIIVNIQFNPNIQFDPVVQSNPEIDYKPDAQFNPQLEFKPDVQSNPQIQFEPDIENNPALDVSAEAGADPQVGVSPNFQFDPTAQFTPQAQFNPNLESNPGFGFDASVAASPNNQFSPQFDFSPDLAASNQASAGASSVLCTTPVRDLAFALRAICPCILGRHYRNAQPGITNDDFLCDEASNSANPICSSIHSLRQLLRVMPRSLSSTQRLAVQELQRFVTWVDLIRTNSIVVTCLLEDTGVSIGCLEDEVLSTELGFCYFVGTNPLNWDEAQEACEARNKDLVSIQNLAEENFINDLFSSPVEFWIGAKFNTDANVNKFEWIDGSSMDYTNWNSGENDGGGGIKDFYPAGLNRGGLGTILILYSEEAEADQEKGEVNVVDNETFNWDNGQAFCGALAAGGHLAELRTQEQNDLVTSHLRTNPPNCLERE